MQWWSVKHEQYEAGELQKVKTEKQIEIERKPNNM